MSDWYSTLCLSMFVSLMFFIPSALLRKENIRSLFVDFIYSTVVGFFGFLLLLVIKIKIPLEIISQLFIMLGYCLFMRKSGLRDLLRSRDQAKPPSS